MKKIEDERIDFLLDTAVEETKRAKKYSKVLSCVAIVIFIMTIAAFIWIIFKFVEVQNM